MEKFKTVRSIEKDVILRLPISECEKLIANEGYVYTSKSAYKRFQKNLKLKYPAGNYRSSIKKRNLHSPFTNNNRKTTKGRKVFHFNINNIKVAFGVVPKRKTIEKDLGFMLHRAETFNGPIDPITGNRTTTKSGKYNNVKFITTLKKDTTIKLKPKTIKQWFKPILKDE